MRLDQTQNLNDLRIFPYYRNFAIEVPPVLIGGVAKYSVSFLLGQACKQLTLIDGNPSEVLQRGATYFGAGKDDSGNSIQTHWMFCMDPGPKATFGIAVNPGIPMHAVPFAQDTNGPLIKLEELFDFRAVHEFPPPAIGIAEMHLGTTGWLVSTRIGVPHRLGFLIDDPSLPPSLAPGASDISVSAKSVRTGQTIGCSSLEFIDADEKSLFLQRPR